MEYLLFNLKAVLISALIFIPVEQLLAARRQKILRKGIGNDAIYAIVNSIFTKVFMILVAAAALAAASMIVPHGVLRMVSGQAIWLQVVEIIIVGDLGVYIAHRAFHEIPALWKFHAIHHGIEELDWLATFRSHPVDVIATKAVSLAPVYFLGFSGEAIGVYFLIYHWHSLLLHANVRINVGPLKWLIATPQFHHWHHANQREAYDKNFASQLSIIDAVFGTFQVQGTALPEKYGVDDAIPSSYLGQHGYPFLPKTKAAPYDLGKATAGTDMPASDA
ncbi:sterol desaturase family protein [Mesorhizobium opportunistum]|nr:sterol desaturase family protein [Mesorhizobium opportunistum]